VGSHCHLLATMSKRRAKARNTANPSYFPGERRMMFRWRQHDWGIERIAVRTRRLAVSPKSGGFKL
jgi:hypothetical protein